MRWWGKMAKFSAQKSILAHLAQNSNPKFEIRNKFQIRKSKSKMTALTPGPSSRTGEGRKRPHPRPLSPGAMSGTVYPRSWSRRGETSAITFCPQTKVGVTTTRNRQALAPNGPIVPDSDPPSTMYMRNTLMSIAPCFPGVFRSFFERDTQPSEKTITPQVVENHRKTGKKRYTESVRAKIPHRWRLVVCRFSSARAGLAQRGRNGVFD